MDKVTAHSLQTTSKSMSNFHLLYFNARSVLSKLDELRVLCCSYNYHVICIVETWLCSDICNFEISIPGYVVYRKDRDRVFLFMLKLTCLLLCVSFPHQLMPLNFLL